MVAFLVFFVLVAVVLFIFDVCVNSLTITIVLDALIF